MRGAGRKGIPPAVAAALLAAASAATPAQGRAEGVILGGQAGAAVPVGKSAENLPALSSELRFALPLALEVGYAFQGPFSVSLYGQYAPGPISRSAPLGTAACTDYGAACTHGHWTDLGVRLDYLAAMVGPVRPRLGIGAGYEWVGYDVRDAGGSGALALKGFQLKLQGSADLAAMPGFLVGPVLTLSAGRFDEATASQGGSSSTTKIAKKDFHAWIGLGIQVRLEL